MMEDMEPDANQREMLYQHDMGIVRLRRHLRQLAQRQIEMLGAGAGAAAGGSATTTATTAAGA